MELELLLMEEKTIKHKIKSALKTASDWFDDKIDYCKDKFDEVKLKFTKKASEVEDPNIKSILKKGIVKIKELFDNVVKICQKMIRYIMGISDEDLQKTIVVEKIEKEKLTVRENLSNIAIIIKKFMKIAIIDKQKDGKAKIKGIKNPIDSMKGRVNVAKTIYKFRA